MAYFYIVRYLKEEDRKAFDTSINRTLEEMQLAQIAQFLQDEQDRQRRVKEIAEVG